ncbi:MAG: AEC family transporter [Pseudomonadota bacterium]
MTLILQVAFPVFAVIAAGFFAGRFNLIPGEDVASLNRFVFRFAMPAALFGLTATAKPIDADALPYALAFAVAAGLNMGWVNIVARHFLQRREPAAGAIALSSSFGNAVFLGLPIAMSIEGWAENFVVLMLVEGIGIIALGAAMLAPGSKTVFQLLTNPLRNPIVAGMITGLIVSGVANLTSFSLPEPVIQTFRLLGRAAGPTALFAIGLFLSQLPYAMSDRIRNAVLVIGIAKLLALPALTFGILWVAGLRDPTWIGPIALFTLVPSAVGSFVMADQAGAAREEVAMAVAITTVFSVLTVSGVLLTFT